MMSAFLKLNLILFLKVGLFSFSSHANETITLTEVNSQKERWKFSVAEEQLAQTPDWQPGQTKLSLSIEQAASLALAEFKKSHEGVPAIQSIGVYSVYTSRMGYKWYYKATIYPIVDEIPKLDTIYDAVILLDGTVIQKTKL